jgi:iron complex outermembrane receptor protein
MKSSSLRTALLSGVALAAAMGAGSAFAQQAQSTAGVAAQDGVALEEVVVTGSSIRGVAPVGSALIGVTRDTIQATAPANTKEMMAALPQLGNFGANAEQSTSNRFRTAGYQPNIHNLGIYATLTLVNGHRIAPTGGEAVFPDPSIVPVIAVQRVELIADGASAIYGSDAVAGVVNFIYRKPQDTLEASATYGFDGETRYQKRNFAFLAGKTWSSGGLMAAYEYSDNKSPMTSEIPFLALGGDQSSRGGRDLRGSNCLTPQIRNVTFTSSGQPRASGTTYGPAPTFTTNAVALRCGNLSDNTVIPDGKRHAFLLTAEHQLTDNFKVSMELNHSYYSTESLGGRQTLNIVVPRTNPYFAANVPPAYANNANVFVIRSGLGLFPQTNNNQYAEFTGLTLNGEFDFGNDWKGVAMLHASRTRDYNNSQELDLLNLQAAANGTTTATALNPFSPTGAGTPQAVLDRINNGFAQDNKSSQRLRELQFKADGPLLTIPGGEIRAALGVDFRNDQSIQHQTAGSQAPSSSYFRHVRDDNIRRSIFAGFYEFNVPLVSEANAKPLVNELRLSLSGRYDYYEAYGGKFNPKYGVVYSPVEGLNFHASYGTNFAAPNAGLLGSIFGVPQTNSNYATFGAIAAGPYKGQTLGVVNVFNLGGGNPDLEPEEAKTHSFGFDYTPSLPALEGLRFGATYYYVDYTNLIYKATQTDIIGNAAFERYRTIFPTEAEIQAAIAFAPAQQPITTSYDVLFASYAINIGSRHIGGVDYDVSYRWNLDNWGSLNLAINANNQLTWEQQVSDGLPFVSNVGTEQAPDWKVRYSAIWNYDALTLAGFVNYVSSFRNLNRVGGVYQQVDSFTTLDLTAAYEFRSLLKGVTLQGRVSNVFDTDPPFYDNANGYFPALASPFGRTIDLTLRAKF